MFQYLLNQMQERYRSRSRDNSKEEQQKTKMASKIYSETEFDKKLQTIHAKDVQKIINMIDFGAIIIGYMGKKNLDLKLSDFI